MSMNWPHRSVSRSWFSNRCFIASPQTASYVRVYTPWGKNPDTLRRIGEIMPRRRQLRAHSAAGEPPGGPSHGDRDEALAVPELRVERPHRLAVFLPAELAEDMRAPDHPDLFSLPCRFAYVSPS